MPSRGVVSVCRRSDQIVGSESLETFPALSEMSVVGGKADENRAKADIASLAGRPGLSV